MVYLLKMVIFHGYVSHSQMVIYLYYWGYPPNSQRLSIHGWSCGSTPRHERPRQDATTATITELAQVEVDPLDVFMSGMEDELTKEPWWCSRLIILLGFGYSCWVLLPSFTPYCSTFIHIYPKHLIFGQGSEDCQHVCGFIADKGS